MPTKLEWETAATNDYNLNQIWLETNSNDSLHKVGQLESNKNQLFDMYGNVWEWIATPTQQDSLKIVKGGSYESALPECLEVSQLKMNQGNHVVGFRVAKSLHSTN